MRVKRSALILVGSAVAVVLGAASYAFACSAQAQLADLSPGEGPRGTEVTVRSTVWSTGPGTESASGPVQIRWGSASGPLLATAELRNEWSAKVTIPDDPPDYYLIVAQSVDDKNNVVLTSSQTFRLTGPATTTATPAGGATTQNNTSSPTAGATTSPAQATEAPSAATAEPAGAAAAVATPASRATPAPAASAPAAGSSPAPAASPATSTAPSAPAGTSRQVRSPSGVPATAGAVAPAGTTPLAPAPTATAAQPLPDPAKVWSGGGARTEGARPSLVSEVPAHQGSTGLAVALFAVGTMGLLSTGVIVAAGRRRVAARTSTR